MPKAQLRAIAFDLDGTLLESLEIKTLAFRQLFRRFPNHVEAIVQYHLQHCGVSRFVKMEYIYRKILRQPLSPAAMRRTCKAFGKLVTQRVIDCAMVPGAADFLRRHQSRLPLFVVSAIPASELRLILRRRGLRPYFQAIFGAPMGKDQALRRILSHLRLKPEELLFVGDASADRQAAQKVGVSFIGRITPQQSQWGKGPEPLLCRDLRGLSKAMNSLFISPIL